MGRITVQFIEVEDGDPIPLLTERDRGRIGLHLELEALLGRARRPVPKAAEGDPEGTPSGAAADPEPSYGALAARAQLESDDFLRAAFGDRVRAVVFEARDPAIADRRDVLRKCREAFPPGVQPSEVEALAVRVNACYEVLAPKPVEGWDKGGEVPLPVAEIVAQECFEVLYPDRRLQTWMALRDLRERKGAAA